jgi:transketolase
MKKTFSQRKYEQSAYETRKLIIETMAKNGEGHAGGALSCADILTVLFQNILNIKPDKQKSDKFILSAGHKCLALYAALCEAGLLDRKAFETYNKLGTVLAGHPDAAKIPAIDFSTGSLGHGLSLACGYALAAKRIHAKYKTYVLMGDGEQGEGSNWEAAAFAAHNKLDNLVAILDENSLQINGRTCEICKPTSYEARYAAFGWSVRVIDGHDACALYNELSAMPLEEGKPSIIVAKTIKGRGVLSFEDNIQYHHWNPNFEQGSLILKELENR